MSWTKTGGEFLVNTTTIGGQIQPNISGLANGGFVISWTDGSNTGGDVSDAAIRGQIYTATGVKTGGEFLVNSATFDAQTTPAVANFASSGFAIVWRDNSGSNPDNNDAAVRGQLFTNYGAKDGGEFLVNTNTIGGQIRPSIAALTSGSFVVAWQDFSGAAGDTSDSGIRAQMFSSTGTKIGNEFLVNTTTIGLQGNPRIAALSGGGFVVTWFDNNTTGDDPSNHAVRAQIYDGAGSKVGGQFRVNTTVANSQDQPSIAPLTNGGFVVVWQDASTSGADTSYSAVRGQIYDATGGMQGGEFLINTVTTGSQWIPSVAALSTGGFVVAWQCDSLTSPDLSSGAVRAQQFDNTGAKIGSDFLVNTTTHLDQTAPTVAGLPGGGFVISWVDSSATGSDASGTAVRAQMFTTPVNPNLFLLSAGVDAITGTSANDTLTGANGDLQPGDTINGGGGIDVLEITAGPSFDLRTPASIVAVERLVGTAVDDEIILNSARGIQTIDGAAGYDKINFFISNAPIDLQTFGTEFVNIEEFYINDSGTTTLIVRASDLATISKIETASAGGTDTLATAEPVMMLVGKTLININHIESLSTTGTAITPPTAWVGTITGGIGDDVITLSVGNTSTVTGGLGTDSLVFTGTGSLTIPVTSGIEAVLYSGSSAQTLTLPAADSRTFGLGAGDDTITGSTDADRLFLGTGNDSFSGLAGADLAIGEGGSDTLDGGSGADTLFGGTASSWLSGGDDADTLVGGGGDDTLLGGSVGDTTANLIFGGAGNDSITGAGVLVGGTGNDTVTGDAGSDTLFGVSGANQLFGGDGDDVVRGGSDADTISGGAGNDLLFGDAGGDSFRIQLGGGFDVIADFQVGSDTIDLRDCSITAASFGTLSQTAATNGVILWISATQSISIVGLSAVSISDVVVL
ncbi:MAG: calcium-binding protein [Alphaproteobacteria bacterium]|nr:MAG: calcium-binding protein [Alphaproteobacteria bacterium]